MTRTGADMSTDITNGTPTNEIPIDLLDRHPSTVNILRWFAHGHLPEHLQAVSEPIADLAYDMARRLPDDPELVTGLRKLLEGKDCLVRVAVAQEQA